MKYPLQQPEWRMLIDRTIEPQFNSFALQLILERIRKSYETHVLSMESAIDQLYRECDKNEDLFRGDLDVIFSIKETDSKRHSS